MVGEILKIKTKIPPLVHGILERSRIQERMEADLTVHEGFSRQLTLISAPAGFGKTTLVRKWIAGFEDRVAWYSLDEGDNEQKRYWIYLISALQTIQESLGSSSLAALRSEELFSDSSTGTFSVLTSLLNDLFDLNKPLYLILDDYHLVNNSRIHEDMIFFVDNLPPGVHLIVTTRSDPPWPLAKWRGKGKMLEFRQDDLKFSREETCRLFTELKCPSLNETQLNTLHHKTEGWVTGLQLAAFSLSADHDVDSFLKQFAGSTRHVLHFLVEEVFNRQPETVQDFLLQTSIMERFNASLCNAVTGRENSAEVLDNLERDNLFVVPLDEHRYWLRYHHLFADFLYYQLKRNQPEKISGLHDKAANWFLKSEEPGEAIRHSLASNNSEKIAVILHGYHRELLQTEPELRNRSLNILPPELLKKYPRLIAHKALFALVREGKEEAEACLKLTDELNLENKKEQKEVAGLLAAVHTYYNIYSHQFSQALNNAEKALELLSPHDNYWRMSVSVFLGDSCLLSGNPKDAYPFYLEAHQNNEKHGNHYLSLSTCTKVATSLYYRGKLSEAEELTRKMLQFARKEEISGAPRVGALWTLLGELMREKGDLEEAERSMERGLFKSKPEKPSLGWNLLFRVALSFSQQNYEEALSAIRQIENLHGEVEMPYFVIFPSKVWKARILLKTGEEDKSEEVLSEAGIKKDNIIHHGQEKGYLVLARLLLLRNNNADRVRQLLEHIESSAARGDYRSLFLETLLVKTALEEKYSLHAAESILETALQKGMSSGYFQLFIDEGNELASVYSRVIEKMNRDSKHLNNTEILNYTREIYGNMAPAEKISDLKHETGLEVSLRKKDTTSELIEDLSTRELEILQLISQGFTNRDISGKLFLSLNTVKWYNSNIFGKLGVRNRTEATRQAQKLNLI